MTTTDLSTTDLPRSTEMYLLNEELARDRMRSRLEEAAQARTGVRTLSLRRAETRARKAVARLTAVRHRIA